YNGSLPGYYPSEGTFLGAVSDYYTSHSFCDVQVSGVTGTWGDAYWAGLLFARTSNYAVTVGEGQITPCHPNLVGTPWMRQLRAVHCDYRWSTGYIDGSPVCFCPDFVCTNEPPPDCKFCKGNPVEVMNMNKKQVEVDYRSSTASGLQFARTFNSRFKDFADKFQNITKGLSSGWTATYLQRIVYTDAGPTSGAF